MQVPHMPVQPLKIKKERVKVLCIVSLCFAESVH